LQGHWGVVREILDESSYASTPKFFNALKTSMVRICALAVAKPVDQGSPISNEIAVSRALPHEIPLPGTTVTSPKEFSSPTVISAAFSN